jgi:hypothetical protein
MAEERLQRRLAAVLAVDVVGYSRLMGVDEAGTLVRLEAMWCDLLDPTIAAHSGRVVKLMGDGVLAEFGSAADAVACAIEIQKHVRDHDAVFSGGDPIQFRIGINVVAAAVRPIFRGLQGVSPYAVAPTPWYFIRFRKSKCVCATLLVTKIIRGTAPERGSSKAPRQVKAVYMSRLRHTTVNKRDVYSGRPPSHETVLGQNPVWSKIEIVVATVGYPVSASPCCSSRGIFPRAITGGATGRRAIGGTDGVGTPPGVHHRDRGSRIALAQ